MFSQKIISVAVTHILCTVHTCIYIYNFYVFIFWPGMVLVVVVLFSAAAVGGLLFVPWDFFYLKRTSAYLH